jgi:hypothetical protein
MHCRICHALKRELGREGETEATATLKQRARMITSVADDSQQDVLDHVILVSRKRRAHIATELHTHRKDVHGVEEDQLPGVRKASA